MKCLPLLIPLAALGLARTADAKPGLPSWCATEGLDENVVQRNSPNLQDALTKDDPAWGLYDLVIASCTAKDDDLDEHRGELAARRQFWNKELDMTDADWADVAAWSLADQGSRYGGLGTMPDDKRAWSSYDPADQYKAIAGAQGGGASDEDFIYLADALGPNLSELGRFGYIWRCLRERDASEVEWAMCEPDIALFDAKKVAAEIRASKSTNGYERTSMRFAVREVRQALPKHAADVKALIAGDSAYGKLFTIAAATRKDWDARWKSEAPLLALVLAMDDARVTKSRKALDGCEDKTVAAFQAALAKIPAKEFENMRDNAEHGGVFLFQAMPVVLTDPDGYLASMALATCHADAEKDQLAVSLGNALMRYPGFRGPRTASMMAMANAGITLDDRDKRLDFPNVHHDSWFHAQYAYGGGGGNGVIATAKSDGKVVHVTFTKKLEKQVQCAESRTTGRLARIDSSGQLIYQEVCVKSKTVTVNTADDPVDVDVRYANGVKPGVFLSAAYGIAQAVWPKSTSTTPAFVFGVAVK